MNGPTLHARPTADSAGFGSTLSAAAPVLEPRRAVTAPPGASAPPASSEAPAPNGWIRCDDLLSPAGLDAAVAHVREHNGSGDRHASDEVAVSYLTAWYAANIVGPAIAAFVLARRVPDLDPAGISVRHREGGWFDATAFHHTRLTVLRSDPAVAGSPVRSGPITTRLTAEVTYLPRTEPPPGDVHICGPVDPIEVVEAVADVETLRSRLVGEIVAHLEPVVAALRPRARLGHAALWGAVAAQCGRTFLLTERVTGDPHLGRAEADAFFEAASPPLRARPTWQRFVHHGRPYTGMRRGSCCLAHRLTEEFCTACPFVPADERETRLRKWIDVQGPGGLAV